VGELLSEFGLRNVAPCQIKGFFGFWIMKFFVQSNKSPNPTNPNSDKLFAYTNTGDGQYKITSYWLSLSFSWNPFWT
jgi:hypothetical protein